MKKNIKKLFVVSGVVLSTSVVLQQFTLEQVRAEEIRQFNNEKVTNVKLEKSTLSREEFIKAVIKENKENGNKITSVYLHKLGSENLYKNKGVKLEDLDAELPQNISFVTINGEKISGGRVVFVDKEDEVINTEEEYNELFKKYGMEIGKYKKVHTSANIKIPVHLSNSFAANGLFWGETNITAIINNNKIYTQYIGLSCDYANFKLGEPIKVTCDLASYKKNDENIHEFIKAAGIDENDSDEEKVVKLSLYALNNIPYGKYSEYAQNSSIFSLATRKTSMCVGFSLGISRALNLMGIPAYMVSGHSGAGPHATVRAYYNNQWHTIDATANGSPHNRESFYRYVVDSYDLYDGVEKVYNYSNGRLDNRRYMLISREYENWAKEQKTEDLVIVNKDAIIKRTNTVQISNELKQNLLERYELLIKNYDNLKTYLESKKDEKSGDLGTTLAAILKSIEHSKKEISDLKEKLNQDDKLFLEEYKKYDQDLRRHYGFLEYLVGQTERIGLKFHNSNNDRKEKELSEKAIELLKQHNLSEKELKEVEKTKLEQEEAEKLKQEQELAKQEEAKKEEQRRQEELKKQEEAKEEEQRRQEELKKQEEAEKAKQEEAKKEEQRRQEELKKQEEAEKLKQEEQRRQEEMKKQEEAKKEEQRRQEELKKQEEAKKEEQRRQEELKKQEEAKKEEQRRQEELKKQEEAKKEEQRRQEELKKQEEAEKAKQEAAKKEEQRRQEEMKKQEEAKKEEQRRKEEIKKQETDKEKDINTKETQKQEKLKFEKSKGQHSEINKLMKLEHSAEVKDNTETKEQKKLSNTGENTQSGMYGLLGLFMSIFAYFKRKNN